MTVSDPLPGDLPSDLPGEPAADPSTDQLAATVERLRAEVDGLRLAMRSRALIEQAKGMLMERHGCTPDQAFERLAKLSQHANVKLADVAAALVDVSLGDPRTDRDHGRTGQPTAGQATAGQTAPQQGASQQGAPTPADAARAAREQLARRWPKQASGEGEFGTRLRAQGRRTRVRAELMAAREPDDVLGAVVGTALGDHPPQAAALAAVDVNGLLSTVSTHGVPGPVAARWRYLPVDLRLPVTEAVRTGRPLWLTSPAADPDTPLGLGLPDDWTTAAVLPLLHDGSCHGVLGMTWSGDPLPDAVRSEVERVAAGAAAVLHRLTPTPDHAGPGGQAAPGGPAGLDPAIAVLDVLLHPVVLCDPVLGDPAPGDPVPGDPVPGDPVPGGPAPDGGDRLLDLRVRHANQAAEQAAGAGRLSGRSFLELWPDSVRSGLFAACGEVRRTGRPADLRGHPWRFSSGGRVRTGLADLRVTRYRDGVLITWGRVRSAEPEPGRREARP